MGRLPLLGYIAWPKRCGRWFAMKVRIQARNIGRAEDGGAHIKVLSRVKDTVAVDQHVNNVRNKQLVSCPDSMCIHELLSIG